VEDDTLVPPLSVVHSTERDVKNLLGLGSVVSLAVLRFNLTFFGFNPRFNLTFFGFNPRFNLTFFRFNPSFFSFCK